MIVIFLQNRNMQICVLLVEIRSVALMVTIILVTKEHFVASHKDWAK